MSTLHKFKAYFGMVPLEDYEDDYVDDRAPRVADDRGTRRPRPRDYADRGAYGADRYAEDRYGAEHYGADGFDRDEPDYPEPAYKSPYKAGYPVSRRDDYADEPYGEDRYEAPRRPTRIETAPSSGRFRAGGSAPSLRGATRGALAVDPEAEERRLEERVRPEPAPARRPGIFEDGGPLSKITTLRPRDYSEARIIGERFREGNPVIMDLVDLSNADAKRLVDFAAGLAFALRGSFDKVATKVFLLSPADVDVSAEERRRIAETGFYNQK
ncbi:cell division protein SepF [Nocardia brasiliensis]|uniref:cell division protein SepF n=1 Tax=Nocardia brasiliensis TaxID=37326 RepID=UPI0004A6B90D|nr:cell division protein SepF [Nocardia brasiliensis]MBF6127256.1 cell division protein SepF [Nocardia brasiliensis]MBF6547433.1 cell division protein SepF [Nocardia brasiliensis]